MKKETFVKRLKDGKTNNMEYTKNGFCGLVNIWRYEDKFIITWEECKDGDQWNETAYTIDDRYTFDTVDEVVNFIELKELDFENFMP